MHGSGLRHEPLSIYRAFSNSNQMLDWLAFLYYCIIPLLLFVHRLLQSHEHKTSINRITILLESLDGKHRTPQMIQH